MAEILRGVSRGFTWRVVALATPRVWRHCPGCSERRAFRSSDRFRVNAQQRRVDVWLVYRCADCDGSWNCTVVERRTPDEIGADLQLYERNDEALAWRCAFDRALLERAGARMDDAVPFRVDVADDGAHADPHDVASAAIVLAQPLEVRLERVVAAALAVARGRLRRWVADGTLRVADRAADGTDGCACVDAAQALRRPARDGQRVLLAPSALSALTVAVAP